MTGAILAIGLLGSAQAAQRPATEKEIEAIRSALETTLADAQSARFNSVTIDAEGHMCGLINAKNRMGAYTGYQAFTGMIFKVEGKHLAAPMGVGNDEVSRTMCADKGFKLPP